MHEIIFKYFGLILIKHEFIIPIAFNLNIMLIIYFWALMELILDIPYWFKYLWIHFNHTASNHEILYTIFGK